MCLGKEDAEPKMSKQCLTQESHCLDRLHVLLLIGQEFSVSSTNIRHSHRHNTQCALCHMCPSQVLWRVGWGSGSDLLQKEATGESSAN